MRETPRCLYLTHVIKILGYAGRMFVQNFGVYGLVPAAIFGTELNVMEAVFFFPFSVENMGKHLIKLFQ